MHSTHVEAVFTAIQHLINGTQPAAWTMTLPYCSFPKTAVVFVLLHHFLSFFSFSLVFDNVNLTIEMFYRYLLNYLF